MSTTKNDYLIGFKDDCLLFLTDNCDKIGNNYLINIHLYFKELRLTTTIKIKYEKHCCLSPAFNALNYSHKLIENFENSNDTSREDFITWYARMLNNEYAGKIRFSRKYL